MDDKRILGKTTYYLRKCRKPVLVLVILYAAVSAAFLVVMRRPAEFSGVMRHVPEVTMAIFPFKSLWYVARAGSLKVGDAAPGFILPTADRQSTVSLGSFRHQKPVVLIFGSYT